MASARVPVLSENTKSRQTDKIQANAALSAKALNGFPLQPGVLVKGLVAVSGGSTTCIHGLKRVPIGFIPMSFRNYVSGTVALVQVPNPPNLPLDKAMVTNGQGVFTYDLWVF